MDTLVIESPNQPITEQPWGVARKWYIFGTEDIEALEAGETVWLEGTAYYLE